MLLDTINQHPLLKQFKCDTLDSESNFMLGLHVKRLKPSDERGLYHIGSTELKEVLKDTCTSNNVEAVSLMLSFDYTTLCKLPDSDPFHLDENPLSDTDFLVSCIHRANYFSKKDISLAIQTYLTEWLRERLESDTTLFDDSVSEAVCIVSVYQPQLAYYRLQKDLGNDFRLTNEIFSNSNYRNILTSLEEIATYPEYFTFAANALLSMAAREVKLGVYHGNYKAIYYLKGLFYNACARTQVSLVDRLEQLKTFVRHAEEEDNYYRLFVLMKVLGTAANVFDSGEHQYHEDPNFEKYIYSCIELIMRFAGTDDEHGLHFTAEEQLHELLNITTDEANIWGATEVPYYILRLFLASGREWDCNPFYNLNALEERIEELKKDQDFKNDQEYIRALESRLQQLISLVADREFISNDFSLFLTSKSKQKFCVVSIEKDIGSELELHARQSLAERLIFSGKSNIHEINRGWPKYTYVIASFGMIISDTPHSDTSTHRRVFKTMPIKVSNYTIAGRRRGYNGHAEEAFFQYILQDGTLPTLLTQFKNQFGISSPNHKVYGIVFDLHGTYDMCVSCSKNALTFQDQFRDKILLCLQQSELKTLRKYPTQLPIIIRYSSDIKYHYHNSSDNRKQGLLSIVRKEGDKRNLGPLPADTKGASVSRRDIKHYGANLLIHGGDNWHTFWSQNKRQEFSGKPISLESWSAFTTDRHFSSLSEEEKRIEYTRLNQVETDADITDSMSKLALQDTHWMSK